MRGHVGTGRRVFDPRRNCSSGAAEPSLAACSSSYVVEMYYAWLEDHKNVHEVQWTSTKGTEALYVPFKRSSALSNKSLQHQFMMLHSINLLQKIASNGFLKMKKGAFLNKLWLFIDSLGMRTSVMPRPAVQKKRERSACPRFSKDEPCPRHQPCPKKWWRII